MNNRIRMPTTSTTRPTVTRMVVNDTQECYRSVGTPPRQAVRPATPAARRERRLTRARAMVSVPSMVQTLVRRVDPQTSWSRGPGARCLELSSGCRERESRLAAAHLADHSRRGGGGPGLGRTPGGAELGGVPP